MNRINSQFVDSKLKKKRKKRRVSAIRTKYLHTNTHTKADDAHNRPHKVFYFELSNKSKSKSKFIVPFDTLIDCCNKTSISETVNVIAPFCMRVEYRHILT